MEFLPSAGTQGGVRHDEKAQNSGVTPTRENDFQIEQALSAEQAGRKLGIILEISYADNDAVNQSTQILTALQRGPQTRPDGIVFEPVGRDALPSGEPSGSGRRGGMGDLEPGSGHISELRRGAMAYYDHHVFFASEDDHLRDYGVTNGELKLNASSTIKFDNPGATPSVSANGAKDVGFEPTRPF